MISEELGPGDAAPLAELERAAFDPPWSEQGLAAELAKEGAFALAIRSAAGGAELAAAALFSTVLGEAELLRVATRPAARRRGLAAALLAEAFERLGRAGIATVFLEVDEGNAPARTLYQKLGFAEVGRRPGYYRGGADAILYRRDRAPESLNEGGPGA